MPVYDVACKNCDYFEEVNITIAEYELLPKMECPKCGKQTLYQNYEGRSHMTFILKGDGWTGKIGGSDGTQSKIDALEREYDRLKEAPRTDAKFRKSMDMVKKAEDMAAKEGLAS